MGKPVYLSGKISWAKLETPDKYGNFSCQLHMDEVNQGKFKALKLMNHLTPDADGVFARFKRAAQKNVRGKMVGQVPPEVIDKDGKPLRGTAIGNGSDVTIKLDYYQYEEPVTKVKKSAVRLDAVRVDNLVPYDRDTNRTPEEQKQIGELDSQPEPLF